MDSIAAEKRTAMLRYARLRRIATLFRCLEAAAVAAFALWSAAHIPAAARSSGDLLRRLLPVLLGPRFLFLLGNAIVLTLLFKSRGSGDSSASTAGESSISISAFVPPPPPAAAPEPAEEVVFEDKKVMHETAAPPQATHACRRSRSERGMTTGERRRRSPELRRSETDVRGKGEEDAEEFRRTIEAFIEKQLKFQRAESLAIVCSDATTEGLNCSAGTVESKEIMV